METLSKNAKKGCSDDSKSFSVNVPCRRSEAGESSTRNEHVKPVEVENASDNDSRMSGISGVNENTNNNSEPENLLEQENADDLNSCFIDSPANTQQNNVLSESPQAFSAAESVTKFSPVISIQKGTMKKNIRSKRQLNFNVNNVTTSNQRSTVEEHMGEEQKCQ